MSENDRKIKRIVTTALFTALCCVATMIIQIPSPLEGYINMGDCLVLLSAWLLGPLYGTVAAGFGSALADLLTGYAYYAPATLIIKALVALCASVLFRKFRQKNLMLACLASAVIGELIMIIGYFGYAWLILGHGIAAFASVYGNAFQALIGIVGASGIYVILDKHGLTEKI